MDSITHLAAGAITPLAFRKAPRVVPLIAFGIIAGELPDIDFIAGEGPHAMFTLHRGITHSLVALGVFALMLAGLFKLFLSQVRLKEMTVHVKNGEAVMDRADDWPLWQMFAAALLALLLHVYLDCMTTFGTQIFWPFSTQRVFFPAMFIVDFAFTVPLLLIMLYCLTGLKNEARRQKQIKWARLGLLWIIAYPLACLGLSSAIVDKYNQDYTKVGAAVEKIDITPVLGSPFFWKVIGENQREYRLSWVATHKALKQPKFLQRPFPKVDAPQWEHLQKAVPVFKEYASFVSFPTFEKSAETDKYVEYTYRDLRYLYSVPNFLIDYSGIKNGLFNMQIRVGVNDNKVYAWRYLEKGNDANAPWTAVHPPASMDIAE